MKVAQTFWPKTHKAFILCRCTQRSKIEWKRLKREQMVRREVGKCMKTRVEHKQIVLNFSVLIPTYLIVFSKCVTLFCQLDMRGQQSPKKTNSLISSILDQHVKFCINRRRQIIILQNLLQPFNNCICIYNVLYCIVFVFVFVFVMHRWTSSRTRISQRR